ncbi:TRAP transporter permease [Natronomonas marina]|uniref:TRAP transporter permease n=1 Tax=Natronomonas marina TaxID=2961939 RepID=UPI0020C98C35|nr:TRAP transporter fused permease subunit [Natronomonas marina]
MTRVGWLPSGVSLSISRERTLVATVYVLAVGLSLYCLYYAFFTPIAATRFANGFLGIGLALHFLWQIRSSESATESASTDMVPPETNEGAEATAPGTEPRNARFRSRISEWVRRTVGLDLAAFRSRIEGQWSVAYVLFALASLGLSLYVELNFDRLLDTAPAVGYTSMDITAGALAIFLVTYATYLAYGWVLAGVVVGSLIFAYLGPIMPGVLRHPGVTPREMTIVGAMQLSGIYGFILSVGARWLSLFIIFAGMAREYGAIDYISDIGQELTNVFRTGVVHVAVVSSMIMGSINGSAAANTATTGSFTIPMMKRQGVRSDYAGAVEAVASSGGQMLPPVMGLAAFLMADILNISYFRIVQYALFPALLFYFTVAVTIHLAVYKFGWDTEPEGRFDLTVISSGAHFVVPFGVLIYTLLWLRYTPMAAGKWAVVSLLVVMLLKKVTTEGVSLGTAKTGIGDVFRGFKQGALELAPFVGVLGSLGLAIGMLNQTGVTQKISVNIIGLAGGGLLLTLFLTMVISLLFGMGMPTIAAYLLMVVLVTPALVEVGVEPVVTHLFVFYFGMLSAITPPVAISVVIATEIARSSFISTAKQSLRIGLVGFIVPYVFVRNTSLLFWSYPETILQLGIVTVSLLGLAVALTAYDWKDDLNLFGRSTYGVLAIVGMFGPMLGRLLAVGCLLTLFALVYVNLPVRQMLIRAPA